MKLLKSIWCIVLGFIIVAILSIGVDVALVKTDLMKLPLSNNSSVFIMLIVMYRSVFGIVGGYLTARVAPFAPLRHVFIGAFIGMFLTAVGAIVMKEEGPVWYPIALIVFALPSAWVGARIREIQIQKKIA